MKKSEFKEIPWADGYFVNQLGQIKGKMGYILSPFRNRNGYLRFSHALPCGKTKRTFVHHAVMHTFCGPKPDWADVVRHLDDNKDNNDIDNLAWGTYRDNAIDRSWNGNKGKPMKPELVPVIRSRYAEGFTVKSISKAFDISMSAVSGVCSGRTWKHVSQPEEVEIFRATRRTEQPL